MVSHLIDWNQPSLQLALGGAITIGNFDGVHLGHARLVDTLLELAQRLGGPAVALTFDPHPRAVLRPDAPLTLLTTIEDREAALRELGVDYVLRLRTSEELLTLTAGEFFDRLVREQLRAKGMVEGSNFCFGRNREGDVAMLQRLCAEADVQLSIVAPVTLDEHEVSSSRIRQALETGDVSLANKLLGRSYSFRGVVGRGQSRGRTIGFPTANLEAVPTVIPAQGVYAVNVRLDDGSTCLGAMNVGANPTFEESAPKIEVHLLDFAGDLYGRELRVEVARKIREVRKFTSADELVTQLRNDVALVRQLDGR